MNSCLRLPPAAAAPPPPPRRAARLRLRVAAAAAPAAAGTVPPYAALSTPVYALGTPAPAGERPTLCLITYAAPIALEPRHFALSLYRGTLSAERFLAAGRGTLSVLALRHAPLFQILGKTSGRDVDKIAAMEALGFAFEDFGGAPALADCVGVFELTAVGAPTRCGDHDVVLCAVGAWEGRDAGAAPLYTGDLRAKL
jgi:flavin reductase (DIM6/NTAB) family NADH-FMN oxidoreductase RutF